MEYQEYCNCNNVELITEKYSQKLKYIVTQFLNRNSLSRNIRNSNDRSMIEDGSRISFESEPILKDNFYFRDSKTIGCAESHGDQEQRQQRR